MPNLPRLGVKVAAACCTAVIGVLIMAGSAPQAHARQAAQPMPAAAPSPSPAPQPPASPGPTATPAPTGSPSAPPGPASPSPSPNPSPTVPSPGTGVGGCGLFDVTCRVGKAVDGWFKSLVASAINPVFDLLGKSLLSTPRLDQMPRAAGLWRGSLVVANAVFVMFVLAGGLTLMGHQSVQTSYTVKDIAPRLVIGVVAANISLLLIGHAIEFANGLSAALLGQGVNPEEAAGQLKKIIVHAINPTDVGMFIVLVVIWAVLLGLILTFIFVIRIMLTIVLIASAPLALMCHALPQTEGLAKLWWRALAGVLGIQVAQALVFITAMKVVLTTDMITWFGVHTPRAQLDLWIAVCLLYILVRIPSWISRMVWQGGLRSSPLARTARTVTTLLIFRRVLSKIKTR